MTSLPAIRPTRILAPNGKPAGYSRLYQTPRNSGNSRGYRPNIPLAAKTSQNVTEYDRWELVDFSRQIYSRMDVIGAAVEQKNNWAFGDSWEPHYTGEAEDTATRKWIQEASEFLLNQFYPNCNVRGPQYDFRMSLKLMGEAWDRDGDDLCVFTETESHFPQFALFPATMVGSWSEDGSGISKQQGEISGGPFDGARLIDGCILNRNNRIIGNRLMLEDGKHADLDSYNAKMEFEAKWSDGIRGIPKIGKTVLPNLNLHEIDDRILGSIKRACGLTFKFKNAEGEAPIANTVTVSEVSPTAEDANANIVDGSSDRYIHYEEVPGMGGEIAYLDSTQGEEIQEVTYSSPHQNVEAFIKRIQHGSLLAIGWHYELMNLGETGRAASRMLADLANQTIWDRQATGVRRFRQIIAYALAKAAKHGFISKPPSPLDYFRWAPGLPKQISVDAGNDAKIAIDKIKMGMSTVGIEAAKEGYHDDFIARKQEQELRRIISMADRLYPLVKANGITYEQVMQMCRQTSPNPPMNQGNQNQQSQAEE